MGRADPGADVAAGRRGRSPRGARGSPRPWPNAPAGSRSSSLGGFFAWVRHPFDDRSTEDVVEDLLLTHDTLVIPGTAFLPDDRRTMRVSVSNADPDAIATLAGRLARMGKR